MDLFKKPTNQSSVQCFPHNSDSAVGSHNLDFIKPILLQRSQHTRLCKWMVYSRATTSVMAERWPVFLLGGTLGVVDGFSFGILDVELGMEAV